MSDLAAFLNHLASAIPGWPDECPQWDAFRRALGLRRMGHDLGPGLNAACDLALHAHASASPEDVDVALTAAHHAYQAACALWTLQAKRKGSAGPAHVSA